MFIDKSIFSLVSNTHKIVMQSNCNSSRKECQSDTDTESHSDEDAFCSQSIIDSVGLYLFRDTK
jgi:hypothetical protein